MELSERMAAVAVMVTPGSRLADVGCDHGYLSVWLCRRGIVRKALALDVNRGPLQSAKRSIAEAGLQAYIETRLSDGLSAVEPGEVDSVVIAGMGGRLMRRILSGRKEVLAQVRELVLEPQSEAAEVREYLQNSDFRIDREDMVCEAGKYYPVIRAVPGGGSRLRGEELRFGPRLLQNRHPVLREFLKKEEAVYRSVEKALSKSSGKKAMERQAEIQEELRYIRRAVEYYEV